MITLFKKTHRGVINILCLICCIIYDYKNKVFMIGIYDR